MGRAVAQDHAAERHLCHSVDEAILFQGTRK